MKRVLFVDDESNVLCGLRRMLRPQRHDWEMRFALGGEEALRILASSPVDVVVSDMRMPGIDGATLLRQVRNDFPDVVRIILSGQTELEAACRAVPIAHQFLTKPCDAATLVETINRACGLRALLGDVAVRKLVGGMPHLPALPHTYAVLTQALQDPEISLVEIGRIVEQDVGMSAKVLHLVNTAFFGLPRRTTSIRTAISLLGLDTLRNLVLSVEVFSAFEGAGVPQFSLEWEQRHAFSTAQLAVQLLSDKQEADTAFAAGILHDVGNLILATHLPEYLRTVLTTASEERCPAYVVEERVSGVTHAEVGAYLLGLWGLPYPIVEAVANHHLPSRVEMGRFGVVGAVHAASALLREELAGQIDPLCELDCSYLEQVGVADRVPEWRAMTALQGASTNGF